MILQIDVGNTRIHWRLVERFQGLSPVVRERGHIEHGMVPEPAGSGIVTGVELACVAGRDVRDSLVEGIAGAGDVPLVEAGTGAFAGGVHNGYAEPGAMGVDRWLAMVGAFNHYPGGAIVVDAGTAVTVDYVDAGGQHLGGYILPGLHLMSRALGANTARVRHGSANEFGPAQPGCSTADCVNHGIGWIWSSATERLRQEREEYGVSAIVLTGGDAGFMGSLLGPSAVVEPDLVFMGMDVVLADAATRAGLRG